MTIAEMLEEFGKEFKQPTASTIHDPMYNLYTETRHRLLVEEIGEYLVAESHKDHLEMLDSFADMIYIMFGTARFYGWDLEEAIRRIHAANMQKFPASTRRSPWDVVKPENWNAPILGDLV